MIHSGLWLKVDASRRQNDPRKPGKVPASMVRLRSKSGQHGDAERVSSGARRRMSENSGRRVWGQRPGRANRRAPVRTKENAMLYDAILIDADDTLFDFRGAEKNAIGAIIQQLGIIL